MNKSKRKISKARRWLRRNLRSVRIAGKRRMAVYALQSVEKSGVRS